MAASPSSPSLLDLPQEIIGKIYEHMRIDDSYDWTDLQALFHTCRYIHNAEPITAQIRKLDVYPTILLEFAEEDYNGAETLADFISCFPKTAKLRELTFEFDDGVLEELSTLSLKPKARRVLRDVEKFKYDDVANTGEVAQAVPLAWAISLLFPKLKRLEMKGTFLCSAFAFPGLHVSLFQKGVLPSHFSGHLQELHLQRLQIKPNAKLLLKVIGSISGLQRLALVNLREDKGGTQGLGNLDLSEITKLTGLTELQLDGAGIITAGLDKMLHRCTSLKRLTIVDCPVQCQVKSYESGVSEVSLGAKSLVELGDWLEMPRMPSLQSVSIFYSSISAASPHMHNGDAASKSLSQLKQVCTRMASWPVRRFVGLDIRIPSNGTLGVGALERVLDALSPLQHSQAAASLETIGLFDLPLLDPTVMNGFGTLFPNLAWVTLQYQKVPGEALMQALHAFPNLSKLVLQSSEEAEGFSEVFVATCAAVQAGAVPRLPSKLAIMLRLPQPQSRRCARSWEAFKRLLPTSHTHVSVFL